MKYIGFFKEIIKIKVYDINNKINNNKIIKKLIIEKDLILIKFKKF